MRELQLNWQRLRVFYKKACQTAVYAAEKKIMPLVQDWFKPASQPVLARLELEIQVFVESKVTARFASKCMSRMGILIAEAVILLGERKRLSEPTQLYYCRNE